MRSASVLPRALADVLTAPRPVFASLCVECQSPEAAAQLAEVLAAAAARVPPLASYIGGCQVLVARPE